MHARPPARRRDGDGGVRPAKPRLRVPARADLRQRRPRGRDQPRDAEDAVGVARGDGRAAGDRRRRDASGAAPLSSPRDREPDRVRGHVPAPRGSARPLLPADAPRLPVDRGRAAGHRRAADRAPAVLARARRLARGGRGAPGRGHLGLPRSSPRALDGRARPRDARRGGDRRRRLRARQHRPRTGRSRLGAPARSRLRRPRGHRAPVRRGRRAPGRVHAVEARRGSAVRDERCAAIVRRRVHGARAASGAAARGRRGAGSGDAASGLGTRSPSSRGDG